MTTTLLCPCGATTEVEIRAEERAITFGRRTEDCIQRVPAEATPDCCPECGREWREDELREANAELRDDQGKKRL